MMAVCYTYTECMNTCSFLHNEGRGLVDIYIHCIKAREEVISILAF